MIKFLLGAAVGAAVVYTVMDPDGQEMLSHIYYEGTILWGDLKYKLEQAYKDLLEK